MLQIVEESQSESLAMEMEAEARGNNIRLENKEMTLTGVTKAKNSFYNKTLD